MYSEEDHDFVHAELHNLWYSEKCFHTQIDIEYTFKYSSIDSQLFAQDAFPSTYK